MWYPTTSFDSKCDDLPESSVFCPTTPQSHLPLDLLTQADFFTKVCDMLHHKRTEKSANVSLPQSQLNMFLDPIASQVA